MKKEMLEKSELINIPFPSDEKLKLPPRTELKPKSKKHSIAQESRLTTQSPRQDKTLRMSTWQLDDKDLRWIRLEQDDDDDLHQTQIPTRLPSISDLFAKGQASERKSGCISMFQTGSGKTLNISTSGFARAQNLLCLEDNQTHQGTEETIQQLHSRATNRQNSPNLSMKTRVATMETGGSSITVDKAFARDQKLFGLEDNQTHQGSEEMNQQQVHARVSYHQQSSPHLGIKMRDADKQSEGSISTLISPVKLMSRTSGSELLETTPVRVQSVSQQSFIKFHTAGGRSISVSSNALQRARSLLGDPELGSFSNEGDADQHSVTSKRVSKNFISPLRSTFSQKQFSDNVGSGKNLIENFDAEVHESTGYNDVKGCWNCPTNKYPSVYTAHGHSLTTDTDLRKALQETPPGRPLVNTPSTIDMGNRYNKQGVAGKRILERRSSGSAFKRPRVSKFITPLTNEIPHVEYGSQVLVPEESSYKNKVSSRYPFQAPRKYVDEYFGVPPFNNTTWKHLAECIRTMNPNRAKQHCFPGGRGFNNIGKEAFFHMLLQSEASIKHISETWVSNHYKWIVWKLACYERSYPGRYLTISNVMEELKYRYEREINHGHRSAIKKILEGDAPPSSVLVLCISSVQSNTESVSENIPTSYGVDDRKFANVELTDGWYSVNAVLDAPLSKQLAYGKMFVGQKLKIAGAGLCGWLGPVSPLVASSTVSLVLHINGTHRTHWADRLGFSKSGCAPLAFSSIKDNGGAVLSTCVGVQRIYPVLYKERLSDGGYTIRSARMEVKMQQLYSQRRSDVAKGVMSELRREDTNILIHSDSDEKVAKIYKILETSAEPDIQMADMSFELLKSLSVYQAKLEEARQSHMHKSVEKALEDSGLSGRDVTPFMRLSVVGLNTKNGRARKGFITIWNPTEKQKLGLDEGHAYAFSGLVAFNSYSDMLYLQARGPTTKCQQLSPSAIKHFQPFFSPRKPITLYDLEDVPLSSEFDIAGLVIFVGVPYAAANQRKQWVFVTDCSVHDSHSKESNKLLAISFCAQSTGDDSYVPICYSLAGSTVGFCNVIKKETDRMNHIWVAEATENSEYILTSEHKQYTHLNDVSAATQKWAEVSSSTVEKLKKKVLTITGKH